MELQVLIINEQPTQYQVIGIANAVDYIKTTNRFLFASKNALSLVNDALLNGNQIFINKNSIINKKEVTPDDLQIIVMSGIEKKRNVALTEILKLANKNIFAVNVIEAMDFLNCYMKLLNAGIFITDQNREDKYFEIIEAAQENEDPEPPSENATFEEEQTFIENKRKYDVAQENLSTLEKYLNAYDKLAKINFTNTFLNNIKDEILSAETEDQIDEILVKNKEKINSYFYSFNDISQHEI